MDNFVEQAAKITFLTILSVLFLISGNYHYNNKSKSYKKIYTSFKKFSILTTKFFNIIYCVISNVNLH